MNTAESLADLLRRRKEKQEEEKVDWIEVKKNWLDSLNSLMALIRTWLEPLNSQGLLEIKSKNYEISEGELGTYQAPGLDIKAPPNVIKIVPRARMVIGAVGRVDMKSGVRNAMIMRIKNKSGAEQWKFANYTTKWETIPLTEESFVGALKELLDLE